MPKLSKSVVAAAATLGTCGGVATVVFAWSVAMLLQRPVLKARCKADADCHGKSKHCVEGRCVECGRSEDCADTTHCDQTTNTCTACARMAECPGGYACQGGKCATAGCNGKQCTDRERCVGKGANQHCECLPGLYPSGGDCALSVAANPRSCDVEPVVSTAIRPGVTPDLWTCTGVPGVEAQYSGRPDPAALPGSKPPVWAIDQIYLDYADNTLRVPQSFPGNADPSSYDPGKVSVMSPVGCVAPTADGGAAADNCSRGLRLQSLVIGQPPPNASAYDDTRAFTKADDVTATFYAQRQVYGTAADWVTGGVVPKNVYPKGKGLRLRMTGDLWSAPAGTTASDDGHPLALGLGYKECLGGCGAMACAGRYCAGAAPSTKCTVDKVSQFVLNKDITCPDPGPPDAAGAAVYASVGAPDAVGAAAVAPDPLPPIPTYNCNPLAKPMAADCMLSPQCPLYTELTTAPTFAPPLYTGTTASPMANRGLYARTGGCVATRDVWGPGEYEFALVVPQIPDGVDGDVFTSACLMGYVFSISLESENEIVNLFDPTLGADSGASAPTTAPKNPVWVPSEQAPWTGKPANQCAGRTNKTTAAPLTGATGSPLYLPSTDPTHPFDWVNNQGCVDVGTTPAEQLAAANTYELLGCRGNNGCEGPADCAGLAIQGGPGSAPNLQFTCQAVTLADGVTGKAKACLPADGDPLNRKLKAFWKTQTPSTDPPTGLTQVGTNGANCIAFQQAWQTGIDGSRWCGHNNSYISTEDNKAKKIVQHPDLPCNIAVSNLQVPGPRVVPALQAKYHRPDYDGVLFTPPVGTFGPTACILQDKPETPYMTTSSNYGSGAYPPDLKTAHDGGQGAAATLQHRLAFQVPSSTPRAPYQSAGGWGANTANMVTALADNGVDEGANTWHTQAMVASPGVAKNQQCEGTQLFASTLGTVPPGTATYRTVRYRIRWWADKDPTKSFVEFSFAAPGKPFRVLYSTSRMVPSRGGRWVIGPYAGRWASGYDSTGKPKPLPFNWVYVDLLGASFKPYHGGSKPFVPDGYDVQNLKLRSLGSSRDQAFATTISALPATAVVAGTTDTAGKKLTCSAATGPATCEIRCGLERIGAAEPTKPPAACGAGAATNAATGAATGAVTGAVTGAAGAATVLQCYTNADCPSLARPHCNLDDPTRGYCSGCIHNADCVTDTAARCDPTTGVCGACKGGPLSPCTDGHGPNTYCEAGTCVNPTVSSVSLVARPVGRPLNVNLLYILIACSGAVMILCAALGVWVAVRERRVNGVEILQLGRKDGPGRHGRKNGGKGGGGGQSGGQSGQSGGQSGQSDGQRQNRQNDKQTKENKQTGN
jgi:hypothetical protein